jgi:pimeloyl-ACP methyl ester carboxylesterase
MISPAGGAPVLVAHLEVPGARLRYEVSGAGPVLLLIPGAAADATAFAGIARWLRDRFTVVAYDPRGTCRSPQGGPPFDITVQVQADAGGPTARPFSTEVSPTSRHSTACCARSSTSAFCSCPSPHPWHSDVRPRLTCRTRSTTTSETT